MAHAIPVGPAPITSTSKRPSLGILSLDTHVSRSMQNRHDSLIVIIKGLPLTSGASMSTAAQIPMRKEKDSLGFKELPANVYYGVQTARAVENYPISGMRAHP